MPGILWFLFFSVLPSFADTLVVTATRMETPAEELPQAITVIGETELQNKGQNIGEVLRTVPGVVLSQNGGPGQPQSLFLRGAKSEHTIVIVDGIIVNDPMSPSRSFDFSQIPVGEIERIEILRGPQSVLYGSDAMGGAIQIFTKHGYNDPIIRLEYGSYDSYKAGFSAYGFNADYFQTKGFSAADKNEGNTEREGI